MAGPVRVGHGMPLPQKMIGNIGEKMDGFRRAIDGNTAFIERILGDVSIFEGVAKVGPHGVVGARAV